MSNNVSSTINEQVEVALKGIKTKKYKTLDRNKVEKSFEYINDKIIENAGPFLRKELLEINDECKENGEHLDNCNCLKNELKEIADKFPPEEKYRLTDQLIRSSRSINANIAEGHGRFTYKDQLHFCIQARG